jgi:hypothetical protein
MHYSRLNTTVTRLGDMHPPYSGSIWPVLSRTDVQYCVENATVHRYLERNLVRSGGTAFYSTTFSEDVVWCPLVEAPVIRDVHHSRNMHGMWGINTLLFLRIIVILADSPPT